ncbi:electron transport complex subunit RsxG [Necropsobacter massiliensis]|uniref:electron transport complex subunit RsxG n=1 Tax=Necropsobacter massiliensis TaxID=1400001 RepID=UPI00059613AC|nr:electron transport complex subunit RsxG [Necropsobacter massiliensis]
MQLIKVSSRYGLLLGLIALICTALSSGVYFLTKDKIDHAVAQQQRTLLQQVIVQDNFDNDLAQSCQDIKGKIPYIDKLCHADKNGKTVAYAFETTAPDGYSGNIRLLVGMTAQGEILGVRVIEHKETPGLGDKIEPRVSNWILAFAHQRISADNQAEWAVKKDGGKFDQFSGATITPRAVVNQVKRSALALLEAIQHNKAE